MLNRPFDLSVNQRTKNFNKVIRVDSDKSISIRSFLIGSICQKISTVKNVLESDDVISAITCLKKLGVKIKKIKQKIKSMLTTAIKWWSCLKFAWEINSNKNNLYLWLICAIKHGSTSSETKGKQTNGSYIIWS